MQDEIEYINKNEVWELKNFKMIKKLLVASEYLEKKINADRSWKDIK